jgi:hypothetical protein
LVIFGEKTRECKSKKHCGKSCQIFNFHKIEGKKN